MYLDIKILFYLIDFYFMSLQALLSVICSVGTEKIVER